MATKWKNIIKKIKGFCKVYWKPALSVLLMLSGLWILLMMVIYRRYYPTMDAVFFGVLGNILFGTGMASGLKWCLHSWYGKWMPEGKDFYGQWKNKRKKWRSVILAAGAAGLLFACWYFSYLQYSNYEYYWGYRNLASGYMMIITVLIQYNISKSVLERFMREKMESLLEQMEEMNRKSLENALEIERKSLEKVSRSDQLRVDLITNVSHDLKTPLTSMVGYIELMKKEELSDTVRDYVGVISDKAGKLKEMIESLFSLAKVSSGNVELHMEEIELNRLVEQLFADMEDQMKESGLEFVTVLTEDNDKIVTDNLYMYRICQNLLENTLKYSAKGTRVFVKTYSKDNRIGLEITNTAGYPMDFKKEDIIERFARADKARTSDGNGLGLAIVSTYAGALGGEFDIQIDCDQFKAKLVFPLNIKD
ncbi:MAG: sensor histidine kinase [Lachnospiraceae bacterium]